MQLWQGETDRGGERDATKCSRAVLAGRREDGDGAARVSRRCAFLVAARSSGRRASAFSSVFWMH